MSENTTKQKVWTLLPSQEMQKRFYKAKAKRQEKLVRNLPDREFHLELLDSALKKFEV